jgi:phage terminase large subunit GpA-like protein
LTHVVRGREITEWVKTGPNHFLDCRIYGMAAAEHLGMGRFTVATWRNIAAKREAPEVQAQRDLAELWHEGVVSAVPEPPSEETKPPAPPPPESANVVREDLPPTVATAPPAARAPGAVREAGAERSGGAVRRTQWRQ